MAQAAQEKYIIIMYNSECITRHKPTKAPSGRELSSGCETEGERATTKFSQTLSYAGSFHHFVVPLPPGGRLFSPSANRKSPTPKGVGFLGGGRGTIGNCQHPYGMPSATDGLVLLRYPIKFSGVRFSSILSTAATRSGRSFRRWRRSHRSPTA